MPDQSPPLVAISRLVHEAMGQAVANGANSGSMPGHLVEIANWLQGVRLEQYVKPFGWHLSPEAGYPPVFREGAEPPAPLTVAEARARGWRPLFVGPRGEAPIDMVLHCPACGKQHIDMKELQTWERPGGPPGNQLVWDNPPHRSHLCHDCGHIWRPADVPTNGVAAVKTRGKDDSPLFVATNPQG